MGGKLRIGASVLRDAEEFLTDRGADGLEGTGLVAFGPDGDGWPFGRPVQAGEIFGRLQQVSGVELVEDVRLFSADPVTGVRGKEARRIDLDENSLVFSYEHQVRVEAH